MKYITAEGPSTEFSYLTRNGKLDVFIPRPTGHTYPAAIEPGRFVPLRYMAMAQIEAVQELQGELDTAHSLLERAQRVLELYAKAGSASPLPARSVLAAIKAMKAQESK